MLPTSAISKHVEHCSGHVLYVTKVLQHIVVYLLAFFNHVVVDRSRPFGLHDNSSIAAS